MLRTVGLLGLLPLLAPTQFPADARVRIEELRTHSRDRFLSGVGRANVRDAGGERGFDFSFDGCEHFHASHYAAVWRNPQTLTITVPRPESERSDTCDLRVTLRDYIYVHQDGKLTTKPLPASTAAGSGGSTAPKD